MCIMGSGNSSRTLPERLCQESYCTVLATPQCGKEEQEMLSVLEIYCYTENDFKTQQSEILTIVYVAPESAS